MSVSYNAVLIIKRVLLFFVNLIGFNFFQQTKNLKQTKTLKKLKLISKTKSNHIYN